MELQENRNQGKRLGYSCDGLQLSRRGIARIEDVVSEVYIQVEVK